MECMFEVLSIPIHIHQEMYECCIAAPVWVDALFYIGAVASGLILPLGISILIYDYCKEGRRGRMILMRDCCAITLTMYMVTYHYVYLVLELLWILRITGIVMHLLWRRRYSA